MNNHLSIKTLMFQICTLVVKLVITDNYEFFLKINKT